MLHLLIDLHSVRPTSRVLVAFSLAGQYRSFPNTQSNPGQSAVKPKLDRAAPNADSAPEVGLQSATLTHHDLFVRMSTMKTSDQRR
jgi:hypothetical protein